MRGYLITVGSITYALKGRDLLRKKGIKAKVQKVSTDKTKGCVYAVFVVGNITLAEEILHDAGIKITEISKGRE